MFFSKIKLLAVGLLTLTCLGTGAGVVTYSALAGEPGGGP